MWTDTIRRPSADDVVQVLGKCMRIVRHAVLSTVEPGTRICFAGRVYDLKAGGGNSAGLLVDTGTVSGRVTRIFQHTGPRAVGALIDVAVRSSEGTVTTTCATPIHPFYVPERRAYVEIGKLSPGTKLQTAGKGAATIVAMSTRRGSFDVYNLEVEGPHNYYVGDERILVHNKPLKIQPPTEITGYTDHGLAQVIGRDGGRGVNASSLLDAFRNPRKIVFQDEAGTWKFVGKDATVILNTFGEVITAYGKARGPGIWP